MNFLGQNRIKNMKTIRLLPFVLATLVSGGSLFAQPNIPAAIAHASSAGNASVLVPETNSQAMEPAVAPW